MAKSYEHLSLGERVVIQTKIGIGWSIRATAGYLGRCPSSISRELRRGGWRSSAQAGKSVCTGANGYVCGVAHKRAALLAAKPRFSPKLVAGNALWLQVRRALTAGLSPHQVSSTLARMDKPQRISHESIYSAIYAMPKGELRAQMIGELRKSRQTRKPRAAGQDRRGLIAGMRSIDDRPIEVDERLVPGHWEGDLIKGSLNQSQVGTLVERKTLFVLLVKVPRATAACTAKSFAGVLRRVDAQMRLSLTYDQGKEMAAHRRLSKATGMKVYFAHPHSPWERGINENTNGLLRQYLPKGTDLSPYSQADLDKVAYTLNTRPRKSLGWKCPLELFLPEGSFDFQAYWRDKLDPVALEV